MAVSFTARFVRVASLKVVRRELIENISSSAARLVQAAYRGWKVRLHLEDVQRAVLLIQRHWRGALGRRRAVVVALVERFEQENREKRRACVHSIQRWFRGRLHHREVRQSAVAIQSAARAHIARKSVAAFVAKSAAATAVQAFARMLVARKAFLQSSAGALTVQRALRGHWGRRRAAHVLALFKARAARAAVARAEWDAAGKIQVAWRARLARNAAQASATVAMQRLWRGALGKLVIRSRRQKRVLILTRRLWEARNIFGTASARGAGGSTKKGRPRRIRERTRLKRDALFSQRARALLCSACANRIARLVKPFLSAARRSRASAAAVTLQCAYRSYVARVRLHDALLRSFIAKTRLRNRRTKAAKVQAAWRASMVRRTFQRLQRAVVLCQTLRRASRQRKRYLELCKSAVTIQGRWRVFLAKRRARAIRARRARELARLEAERNRRSRKWNPRESRACGDPSPTPPPSNDLTHSSTPPSTPTRCRLSRGCLATVLSNASAHSAAFAGGAEVECTVLGELSYMW